MTKTVVTSPRVVAAIAVEGLTLDELAELITSLARSWPTAAMHVAGRAVLVVMPDPDRPRGRTLDAEAYAQAADELLDRIEQRAQDVGSSGGTSVLSAADRRRKTWRESKARARAAARAEGNPRSAPEYNIGRTDCTPNVATSTTSTVSTVDTSTKCGLPQVSGGVDSVDVHTSPPNPPISSCKNNNGGRARKARRPQLPGLDGPMTETPSTRPDDLRRRRLAAAVPAVLARGVLAAAQTRGAEIRSPDAYLAGTAKRIAVAQAPQIAAAIEQALARWGEHATPTHVAELLAAARPTAATSGTHEQAKPARDETHAARQLAATWARTGLSRAEILEGVAARYPKLTHAQIAEAAA